MSLLDLLFPKTCVGCKAWGRYVCADCLSFIKLQQDQCCPVCNKLSMDGITHAACKKPLSLDGVFSGFCYSGLVKQMIGLIKYQGVYDLVPEVCELFISLNQLTFLDQTEWLVLPVPLHSLRYRFRGFNQSALIGKYLATYWHFYYSDNLLIRNKYTVQQMKLEKKSRQENVKNAFSLGKSGKLNGVNCLLIDDVWTTGATMREAAKPLKRAGANLVWGLTVAS